MRAVRSISSEVLDTCSTLPPNLIRLHIWDERTAKIRLSGRTAGSVRQRRTEYP